ncbi:hypothetical protein evm_010329 [Chilo suppressalis]|nr:hypothetical protein evm_010329 [Chilo suppressalis]
MYTLIKLRNRFHDICNNTVPRGLVAVVRDKELVDKQLKPEDYVNKLNFCNFDPVFSEYIDHPRLVHVVSQIIGDGISVQNSMMINKPPGSKWHPPHQDAFYLGIQPYDRLVTSWTAIDPVSADNGCIFVVPGSHKDNILHKEECLPGFVDQLFFTIPDVEKVAPMNKRVSVAPLEPGDTIFFNSLLVHGSYPNHSNCYRKAITNIYASDECRYFDVKGTPQEAFEKAVNDMLRGLHGSEMGHMDLQDLTKGRARPVHVSKSSI